MWKLNYSCFGVRWLNGSRLCADVVQLVNKDRNSPKPVFMKTITNSVNYASTFAARPVVRRQTGGQVVKREN